MVCRCGTCLALSSPEGLKKLLKFEAEIEFEENEILHNTASTISNSTYEEQIRSLKILGKFLRNLRAASHGASLRKFCIDNKLDPCEVSYVERGLKIPSPRMLIGYQRLFS